MQKSIFAFLSTLILLSCSCSNKTAKDNTIHYPEPRPDSTALIFMPGIVSSDSLDFNSVFSPDGKSFYFARTNNGQWDIYIMMHDGKNWSAPSIAPFCTSKYSEADPAFSPEGNLFYISNRPKTDSSTASDFDIWYIKPLSGNKWSAPVNAKTVNSDSSEYFIAFSPSGNMYLGSARAGGYGSHDIYFSKYDQDKYNTPVNLGANINTSEAEHDPCVFPNEEYLIFKSENRNDGFGEADFYCSVKNADGTWAKAVNLGKKINTATYEYCPNLTPDGKYFFYSSELDIKWIDAAFLKSQIEIILNK